MGQRTGYTDKSSPRHSEKERNINDAEEYTRIPALLKKNAKDEMGAAVLTDVQVFRHLPEKTCSPLHLLFNDVGTPHF